MSVLLADKSALEWARRDKRARAAFLSLRTAHVIAATAELHGAEVLHVDSDYDMIARVTDQPMRRLFDPDPHDHAPLT